MSLANNAPNPDMKITPKKFLTDKEEIIAFEVLRPYFPDIRQEDPAVDRSYALLLFTADVVANKRIVAGVMDTSEPSEDGIGYRFVEYMYGKHFKLLVENPSYAANNGNVIDAFNLLEEDYHTYSTLNWFTPNWCGSNMALNTYNIIVLKAIENAIYAFYNDHGTLYETEPKSSEKLLAEWKHDKADRHLQILKG